AVFDGQTVADNWSGLDFFTMPGRIDTNLPTFAVTGSVAPGSSVALNGVPLPEGAIDAKGAFAHAVPLAPGDTALTVTVRDSLGRVVREPPRVAAYSPAYLTGDRSLLYADSVSGRLDGTVVVDTAGNKILGLLAGQHVRGRSPDGLELYMADRTVV